MVVVGPHSQLFRPRCSPVLCISSGSSQFLAFPFLGHADKQQSRFVCSLQTLQNSLWNQHPVLLPTQCPPFWHRGCSLSPQLLAPAQPQSGARRLRQSQGKDLGAYKPGLVGLGSFHLKAPGTLRALPGVFHPRSSCCNKPLLQLAPLVLSVVGLLRRARPETQTEHHQMCAAGELPAPWHCRAGSSGPGMKRKALCHLCSLPCLPLLELQLCTAPGIALRRSRRGRRAGEHVLYCSNLDWAQPKTFTSVVIT